MSSHEASPLGRWAGLAALLAALAVAVFVANRPIAPAPADAPVESFSEARARPVVRVLADDIGVRPTGSEGAERAAQYLLAQLRALPRWEAELQRADNARFYRNTPFPYPLLRYRVTNVVARLPGRSHEAVLLNAHFDTLGDSDGAGDDALGVAALVETARALSASAPLERTVIVLCNGGEEYGLFGADGFVRDHRWARDVRAYIYLDGSPGGASTLLYAGPGAPELVEAWARVAPRPQGSSAVLDLMESGTLPQDGDFRPLRDAGLAGLSFGAIGDLWAAHTSRDQYRRIQPGTLQHYGATTLALTRELASRGPLPRGVDARPTTYFDVLGLFVVRYGRTSGLALSALALALSALALRRTAPAPRALALALAGSSLSLVAAVLAPLVVGALLAFALHRPHGWYTAPWIALPCFVAPSLAALLAAHHRLARTLTARGHDPAAAIASAALVGWTALLALAALRGARAGYLPLVWTGSLALGALAAHRWPTQRFALSLASVAPGALVLVAFAPLLRTFCAEAAFMPLPIPADPPLGALFGVFTAACGAAVLVPAHLAGALPRASKALAAVSLVGVALSALHPPFTFERPRRVFVVHGEAQGRSAVYLRGLDALPLDAALTALPEARPAGANPDLFEVFMPPPTHAFPAPPPPFDPPGATVVSTVREADGSRTVRLHVTTPTTQLRLFVEHGRLVRWSLGADLAENEYAGGRAVAYFQGVPPEGDTVTLTLRGEAPVDVELIATSFLPDDALRDVARKLPRWAVLSPMVARTVHLRL